MLRPLAVSLALISAAPAAVAGAPSDSDFTADAYMAHVRYLASDELGGRGPGQEGIEKAAEYIAGKFQEFGLEPGGEDQTYFQSFDAPARRTELVDAEAAFAVSGMTETWTLREQWIPFPFSAAAPAEGPLAFAGYGISAAQHSYDDYADFDVKDKVLLLLRYEPRIGEPDAAFGGAQTSAFAQFTSKARTAFEKGAKGVIIVNPTNRNPDSDQLYAFGQGAGGGGYDLPMIHVKREVADAILKAAGAPDLATLVAQIDEQKKPASRDLGALRVSMTPGVKREAPRTRNVLGLLRGSGNTDELIVIGAHYDHLGTRERPEGEKTIYNGADDNASGTSGMLELARVFAQQTPRPRRNILFMAFSAEEMGLIGSRYWVNNPTFPLENVKFMFNLDMIGRFREEQFEVEGSESGVELKPILERVAGELGLKYKASRDMFGRSDHASFESKKIPVLFTFTGLHNEYHRPGDDADLINGEGAVKVMTLAHLISREVADMHSGPQYQTLEEYQKKQRELAAAAQPAGDAPGDLPTPRVRVGFAPRPGLLVATVDARWPAAKAGLQPADLIVKVGDVEVGGVLDYVRAIAAYKYGDTISLSVWRAGETVSLSFTAEEVSP